MKKKYCEKEKKEHDGKGHAHEYHKKQSNVIMHSLVKDMSKKTFCCINIRG